MYTYSLTHDMEI